MQLGPLLERYRTDGFVRLGRTVGDDALVALRTAADDVMAGRPDPALFFYQPDTRSGRYEDLEFGRGWQGPEALYRKVEKLEREPRFRAFMEDPVFERIARAWYGTEITLYRAILMNKPAHGGTVLPWHQDAGDFWGLSRDPSLQIWTALDDAPEEAGCLEVVPRSHEGGLATPLGGVVPAERAQGVTEVLALPASAGESILLHNHLWHRSGTNRTDRPRRAVSICLMDAATQCTRRRRAPRRFVRLFSPRA